MMKLLGEYLLVFIIYNQNESSVHKNVAVISMVLINLMLYKAFSLTHIILSKQILSLHSDQSKHFVKYAF